MELGGDDARRDGIDRDPLVPELDGEALGEANDGGLRAGVGAVIREGAERPAPAKLMMRGRWPRWSSGRQCLITRYVPNRLTSSVRHHAWLFVSPTGPISPRVPAQLIRTSILGVAAAT